LVVEVVLELGYINQQTEQVELAEVVKSFLRG
jgi:hypothetical protein